jgi:soluble lytic murein transglycosylase-like protein
MVSSIQHGKLLIAAVVLAALTPAVRAAELVTLANGYAMRCDHHAQVEGRVRLYLNASEDNYLEVAVRDIVGYEQAPPEQPASEPAAVTVAPALLKSSTRLSSADLSEMLAAAGAAHNLNVDLLASVVKAESNGDAHAVSSAGAQGLMQLMPTTAAQLGVHDSFQPDQNVRGGTAYLDALLTRYGNNLALALAAYNAGPEAVDRYHGIPPYRETRLYVARVIHEFNRRVMAREAETRRALAASAQQAAMSR